MKMDHLFHRILNAAQDNVTIAFQTYQDNQGNASDYGASSSSQANQSSDSTAQGDTSLFVKNLVVIFAALSSIVIALLLARQLLPSMAEKYCRWVFAFFCCDDDYSRRLEQQNEAQLAAVQGGAEQECVLKKTGLTGMLHEECRLVLDVTISQQSVRFRKAGACGKLVVAECDVKGCQSTNHKQKEALLDVNDSQSGLPSISDLCEQKLVLSSTIGDVKAHSMTSSVEKFVETHALSDDERLCCICLSEYQEGCWIFSGMECGHRLHAGCALQMMKRQHRDDCPYCRKEMIPASTMLSVARKVLGAERMAQLDLALMDDEKLNTADSSLSSAEIELGSEDLTSPSSCVNCASQSNSSNV